MKKLLIVLLLFVICSVYIFYVGYKEKVDSSSEGDAPIHDIPQITLGGKVEEPVNDTIKIGQLQTSYIMYVKGDISYDQMVEENMDNLKKVLNYPMAPEKGYLFSADYAYNSRVQVYYQSNQEETRTVVLKVVYNEDGNKVTKIYDGDYYKLVVVDEENPSRVIGFDKESEPSYINVE